MIEGSAHTLSAPQTQSLGSISYAFRSWSDGGERVHNITAATSTTYAAEYAPMDADVALRTWAKRGTGKALTFYLRVKNFGPAAARGVSITSKLPPQVAFNHVAGASCTYNWAGDFLRCPLRTIKPGKVRLVRVYTWLQSFPTAVVNETRVRSTTSDPNRANNYSRLRFELD